MPSVAESSAARSEFPSTLVAGLETLDLNQTVAFTKYIRVVLPLDGFVFWVRADLLQPSALVGQCALAQVTPAQIAAPVVFQVDGSLHYATMTQQQEDNSFGLNRVTFTSETDVQPLNAVGQNCIFIASVDDIRFAFSRRENFYRQADLFHFVGGAIYPAMETQIIDNLSDLGIRDVVVSNSLPIWLSLSQPTAFPYLAGCGFPLYPSFAVPDNLAPPYAAVHIVPEQTQSMQIAPFLDVDGSIYQLSRDRVRITLYGVRNDAAMAFLQYVITHSLDIAAFGLLATPAIRDEKCTQPELRILAQKKTAEFDVDYYQNTVRSIAQQFIESAFVSLIHGGTQLYNNGGFVALIANTIYQVAPDGLGAGALWCNGGLVGIVPGSSPNPDAPLVAFSDVTAISLIEMGGGNFPISPPSAHGFLWNNGGFLAVS